MLRWTSMFLLASTLLSAQAPASQTGSLDFRAVTTKGAPVAGARVTIEGPDGKTYSGATAPDGSFRQSDLAPGVYRFRTFDAPGYFRAGHNFLAEVSIHAGQTREYLLELVPAPRVEGVVRSEEGMPVEGATVEAWSPRGDVTSDAVTTDARGFYSLTLRPDPSSFLSPFTPGPVSGVAIWVSRENYATISTELSLVRPNTTQTRDIALRRE